MIDYVREPQEIYRRSFAIARRETDLSAVPPSLETVALRLVHACGMPDIVQHLAFSPDVASRAKAALEQGATVLVDTPMAAQGITAEAGRGRVICAYAEPEAAAIASAQKCTRAAAAVECWGPRLEGAVVAIGNAPTALFRLLELLDQGIPQPAAILAFPVGFVGAAESKAELAHNSRGVPFLTLLGRRGGSAMAAAAINALFEGLP
ncbi:MAG: precorrin-8X methylmutase [Alphaproteobacteria bacterium]